MFQFMTRSIKNINLIPIRQCHHSKKNYINCNIKDYHIIGLQQTIKRMLIQLKQIESDCILINIKLDKLDNKVNNIRTFKK